MKDLHDIVRTWQRRPNESFVLATLVRARGSSYRGPGARMLIDREGAAIGSLSGGCLEEEVAQCALDVLRRDTAQLLTFDTRRWFGCNGAIDIFLEPLPNEFMVEVAAHLEARQSCLAATIFTGPLEGLGSRVLAFESGENEHAFLQEIHPPPRVIIFGEGPDSAPLRTFCQTLGWQAIEVEHSSALPREVDHWTAAIIKSHNYGRDFAALQHLLPLPLRYLGLVGPRRRRDQLMADALDSGTCVNAELFAPTGLHLGSETPEEIALAIAAEIQRVFARASGESLRDSKKPIHDLARRSVGLL